MGKKQKDWLENIEKGKGREIARLFFLEFSTHRHISASLYPNRKRKARLKDGASGMVNSPEPIISRLYQQWTKEGFFTMSRKFYTEDSLGRKYPTQWKIMNLKPIFKYCILKKKIKFTKEEKQYLEDILLGWDVRKAILEEYPSGDIINASLKFYVKHFINRYHFLLRDIRENKEKYQKEYRKVEGMNHPKTKAEKMMKKGYDELGEHLKKKYGLDYDKKEFDVLQSVAFKPNLSKPIDTYFLHYLEKISIDGNVVFSTDEKILKALDN